MSHIAYNQIRKRNEDAYFDQRTTESLRRFREHKHDQTQNNSQDQSNFQNDTKRRQRITLVKSDMMLSREAPDGLLDSKVKLK